MGSYLGFSVNMVLFWTLIDRVLLRVLGHQVFSMVLNLVFSVCSYVLNSLSQNLSLLASFTVLKHVLSKTNLTRLFFCADV